MTIAWPTTGKDVATSLNWDAARADELEDYAVVAVSKIEDKVGPWHGQTLTHTVAVRSAESSIPLPWPIGALTAITRDGVVVTGAIADPDAGAVYGDFLPGTYTVTATARADTTCPPEVALAGRKLAAHLAKQEKIGPRQPGFSGSNDRDTDVLQGFALPRAVSELIADHVLIGSFA